MLPEYLVKFHFFNYGSFVFIMAIFLLGCGESPSLKENNFIQHNTAANSNSPPQPKPEKKADSGVRLPGHLAYDNEEMEFLNLLNEYRSQHGQQKLRVSVALTHAAGWMSRDMARKNYFNHIDRYFRSPFRRMIQSGYPDSALMGENIAAGNNDAETTFLQWKNSPGHNANMLNDKYKVIGISRYLNSFSKYKWYWTTDFGGQLKEDDVEIDFFNNLTFEIIDFADAL